MIADQIEKNNAEVSEWCKAHPERVKYMEEKFAQQALDESITTDKSAEEICDKLLVMSRIARQR
jgi:predicted house-cleaning noncanonical NTP pyrophosphatase (MazG superfamily)